MTKVNETTRNYSFADAEMLQASGVYLTLFNSDLAKFISFDSDFDTPFSDNWSASITAAEAASQDIMLVDQLANLTQIVEEKFKTSRDHYQRMKYYIEKAYPDNKPIQNEFGFNDYETARKSTPKMISFLTMLSTAAVKYSPELIGAGYSQEDIDKIILLRDELKTADHNQEVFKKNRPLETQSRIEKLNACWEFSQKVCKVGKIIFSENNAKYNQYLIPGEPAKPVEVVES